MATLDTLSKKKAEAHLLVETIKTEFEEIKVLKDSASDLIKSISVDAKDYKKTVTTLNRISNSVDSSIQTFNQEKTKITKSLREVDRFYNTKYLTLVSKIENPETGINAKIRDYSKLSRELNKIEKDCISKYTEVKNTIVEFRQNVRTLNTIDSSIKKLYDTSSKNGALIKSKLNEVAIIEKEAFGLKKKLDKILSDSEAVKTTIIAHEKNAGLSVEKISIDVDEAADLKEKIAGIYDIAAANGRSGEFENRRNKLKTEVSKWETRILVVSIILLSLVIGLFLLQLGLQDWKIQELKANFYLRYLLLSPIVYYLFFISSQHSKAQKLYDKYSFKTTLAMSVQHHIELLTSKKEFNGPEQIESVLGFVLEAFRKIYNEPYADDDYKMKLKLANLELDIEKKMIDFFKQEK